jgi:hypothetical protein
VARKRPIYIDFKKRQKAEEAFEVNPESDPNINAEQNPVIINLQVSSSRIIFLDFKGKKAIPEGFNVEKKNDANVTYRKNRLLLDEVYREKKYEMPPGPRCQREGKIIAAARSEGPCNSIDDAFYILSVLRHTSECARCQAIYDKARLEKSCRIESHEECKGDD